ncbi:hypothetical protein [Actinomadura sp. DC4]|uniref:hypothetical protein n=1 Tax=Actinomadura sp. DC4 TaxID=3055069 RepID=UPI0025AF4160|nr:hypothetical protein [Actinomadura sp. DC4]MDN3356086.1 hypothetical protein [Actinomadura sp. DC4]
MSDTDTTFAARRERLLGRKRRTLNYQLAVDEDADAVVELVEAKDALDAAHIAAEDLTADRADELIGEAEERLQRARDAVAACYEPVLLTAMLPEDFEELAAKPEYAAREGRDERWNEDTFPRIVFTECLPSDDVLSPEEWMNLVDTSLASGERKHLFAVAVGLNSRMPSGSIPNV